MPEGFDCELISWEDIVALVRQLAVRIREDAYSPDIIIAIARGGYIPARLLADYLGCMNLCSIKVEHYTKGPHEHPVTTVIYPLSIDVTGQDVLVVDDVSDSGDTFQVALQHIGQRTTPRTLKTATLHHKARSHFTPDYYAALLEEWHWLTYPWAQVEDLGTFIHDMPVPPTNSAGARQGLKAEYGICAPEEVVDYILKYTANDR